MWSLASRTRRSSDLRSTLLLSESPTTTSRYQGRADSWWQEASWSADQVDLWQVEASFVLFIGALALYATRLSSGRSHSVRICVSYCFRPLFRCLRFKNPISQVPFICNSAFQSWILVMFFIREEDAHSWRYLPNSLLKFVHLIIDADRIYISSDINS